jgi:MFS family permease
MTEMFVSVVTVSAAPPAVRRSATLAVLSVAQFLIALDYSIIYIALPSIAADLLPGLIISGFGHGIIYTSMFIIGTHDVPSAYQGTAGALLTTSQYLSGALTVAVLTLALGPSPDHAGFRTAFLLITAAAASGLVLVASRRR